MARKGWGEKGGQDDGMFGGGEGVGWEGRIALNGDQKPFRLPCDCGNWNPFGCHQTMMMIEIDHH